MAHMPLDRTATIEAVDAMLQAQRAFSAIPVAHALSLTAGILLRVIERIPPRQRRAVVDALLYRLDHVIEDGEDDDAA